MFILPQRVSAKRLNFNFSKLPDSWARVPRPTPPCTGFSNRCCPKKRPKNGAVSGAEVPVLVPFSFPRIVTVFPFLNSSKPGTERRTWFKTKARKRKETPRQPRVFVEKHFVLKRFAAEFNIAGSLPHKPTFHLAIRHSILSAKSRQTAHALRLQQNEVLCRLPKKQWVRSSLVSLRTAVTKRLCANWHMLEWWNAASRTLTLDERSHNRKSVHGWNRGRSSVDSAGGQMPRTDQRIHRE